MKSDVMCITHELLSQADKIKENAGKIKVNKSLPYLVSNIIEILDFEVDSQDTEEEGAMGDLDSQRKEKGAIIKTSTRQVGKFFLMLLCSAIYL